MIYVFGGEKGGTGKTSFATNFAVCLALGGCRSLLYDADPQRSAIEWARERSGLGLPDITGVSFAEGGRDVIKRQLAVAARRYDHVVVDVGGAASTELEYALELADVLLSPFIPSSVDLRTARAIDAIVARVREKNPALRALAFLNKTPARPQTDEEVLEARDELAAYQSLSVCAAACVMRKPFRRAFKFRLTVPELMQRATSKHAQRTVELADRELWALFQEVTGHARAA